MASKAVPCALCGCDIFRDHGTDHWRGEFRAVYRRHRASTFVTGIGVYDGHSDGIFTAPDLQTNTTYRTTIQIGVMPQPTFHGPHGFAFHAACWSLLETAEPALQYKRLYDEEAFEEVEYSDTDPVLNANPFRLSETCQMLTRKPEAGPPSPALTFGLPASHAATSGLDSFTILPQELLEMVAIPLTTVDFLNAREASRAFWPMFHSKLFWASRFTPLAERPWLFEMRYIKNHDDWRWVYSSTKDSCSSPALRNRKRVWGLAQRLVGILQLTFTEMHESIYYLPSLPGNFINTRSRDLKHSSASEGPDVQVLRYFSMPKRLAQLSMSFVSLGNETYACGIAVVTVTRDIIGVGYSSCSTHRQLVDIQDDIKGFHLAIGPRGVQALRCVTAAGEVTRWLGYPDNVPKTKRLENPGRIATLGSMFDGCKLVGFITGKDPSDALQEKPDLEPLRNTAICDRKALKAIDFDIDGPGGETIQAICVYNGRYFRPRQKASGDGLIITNQGRIRHFGNISPGSYPRREKRVIALPGEAITGLYAAQRSEDGCGLVALGVISEAVA
ncbi:hypothetical protein FZEAL_3799 [Fusarium zealandicum]|uniref:DUF7600 domain-containing protein n=1 Tax=Fusarium zealandicum TaxID=1053134 RepID=A0A8H4XLF7_9HYPO|nr:hypothetical protein FZEAL_3799 [Fusarium zealandicum]